MASPISLVVDGQVVRVADCLVGAQGTAVLAHVQRVERRAPRRSGAGPISVGKSSVAPVQVQDRHAGARGRACAQGLRVVDGARSCVTRSPPRMSGAPLWSGGQAAPRGTDVALEDPLGRRGASSTPEVRQAAVWHHAAVRRGIAGKHSWGQHNMTWRLVDEEESMVTSAVERGSGEGRRARGCAR